MPGIPKNFECYGNVLSFECGDEFKMHGILHSNGYSLVGKLYFIKGW